jgi:RNA polymerase sigma-70 factor (ECF subfamily)
MGAAQEPRDEELVRRVKDGDADAARVLFDRHAARLRSLVKRKLPGELRPKVGASDVVQEAWLAAFAELDRFEDRGNGSFARWIRGILEHKALDETRRHVDAGKRAARRETRVRTGTRENRLVARQRSPSGEAAARERSAALRAARAELPAQYRTILSLVHDEGLTLGAAGERLGRSPDAVRMLYGRAVARLAKQLGRPTDAGA